MKKLFIIVIVFISVANTQEVTILENAVKTYFRADYKGVLNILNSNVINKEIKSENILVALKIYLALAYYKLGKEYLAIPELEDALRINPNYEIDNTNFDVKSINFFNRIRKENIGSLKITTLPDGANVYIENEFKGKTPLFIKSIFAGGYRISFIKNRYEFISNHYSVEPDTTKLLHTLLRWSDTYSLYLSTEPEGADVFLDDNYKGRTPLFLTHVLSGSYKLECKKNGFKDFNERTKIPVKNETAITIKLDKIKDYFLYSLLIPGLGQMKMRNYKHGAFALGSMVCYFGYYFHYISTEPQWIYKDRLFAIKRKCAYGALLYKISGKVVSRDLYYAELLKKEEENKKIDKYERKKRRIQSIGYLLHAVNLFDAWYLIKKNKESHFDFTCDSRKEYIGLSLRYRF